MHITCSQYRKHALWLSAALHKMSAAALRHCTHTCETVFFQTGLQIPNPGAQHPCPTQEACFLAQSWSEQIADSCLFVTIAISFYTPGLQMPNTAANHLFPVQETCFLAQCCSAQDEDSCFVSLQPCLWSFAFMRVCKCPTLVQSTLPQHRKHASGSELVCTECRQLLLCHYSHTCASFPFIGLQMPNTDAHHLLSIQKTCFLAQCCSA